ncbi:MAG TPA: hypothetical protein VF533_08290, partial [Solirubrobacteraceae bacterium]
LSAGGYHTCALKTDGTPVCWGRDDSQQATGMPAGIGTVSRPTLDAGSGHTCAVKPIGTPVCWGADDEHQGASGVPAQITVGSISAGSSHTCAVKTDATPVCWGNSDDQQAASGVPAQITVDSVSAGQYHSCAVKTDATPVCWGSDSYQQSDVPAQITVTSISVGRSHTCAVKTDGTPICWGYDGDQQVSGVPDGITVRSISAGQYHTCAVKTDGTPVCWGWNGNGQVSGVPDGITVTSISAGGYHTCAVKTDGTLVCWGSDGNGRVSGAPPGITVSSISAGLFHTCAVKTDGTPVCWGDDGSGQASPPRPVMTVRPTISAPKWAVGETVSAEHGTFSNSPDGYRYAWYRCTNTAAACNPISGATGSTYQLTSADDNRRIRVRVTATNWAGSDQKFSLPSPVVGVPVKQTGPTIDAGPRRTGDVVTVNTGTWEPAATGYEIEWLRCGTLYLNSCSKIASDTDNDTHYTLVNADDAKRIRARVTATNAAGSSIPATTAATVLIDRPTLITRPTLFTTTATEGVPLSTHLGDWTGNPTSHKIEWLRCTTIYLAHCTKITTPDATDDDTSYTPTADDVGQRLRSRIQAHNASGDSTKSTTPVSKKVTAAV